MLASSTLGVALRLGDDEKLSVGYVRDDEEKHFAEILIRFYDSVALTTLLQSSVAPAQDLEMLFCLHVAFTS